MGNCLVLQENIIKVMKTDGKVLEYRAPMRVHEVLSEFSGLAISDSFPVVQYLRADTKLLGGHLYYLVPPPLPSPKVGKKKVRFSIPEEDDRRETGVVRIKFVISKQQLEEMLQKGVSFDHMVPQLQDRQKISGVDTLISDDNCSGWKPALESIVEAN